MPLVVISCSKAHTVYIYPFSSSYKSKLVYFVIVLFYLLDHSFHIIRVASDLPSVRALSREIVGHSNSLVAGVIEHHQGQHSP